MGSKSNWGDNRRNAVREGFNLFQGPWASPLASLYTVIVKIPEFRTDVNSGIDDIVLAYPENPGCHLQRIRPLNGQGRCFAWILYANKIR